MSNSDMKSTFALKSSNAAFAQRQKSVFDQLNVLENNRINTSYEQETETDQQTGCNKRIQRSVTKHFRGKESIFKKPQNPIPKNYINRIPDFKKNPHKWTKYSLDDVKEDDMSDKGNTRAALSFLKELEDRKSTNMECDDDGNDDLPTKITFKRYTYPVSIKKEDNKDEDISKPSFRSSKVVMPEYVVGQKAKKDKKNNSTKTTTGKELKLDHLYEED